MIKSTLNFFKDHIPTVRLPTAATALPNAKKAGTIARAIAATGTVVSAGLALSGSITVLPALGATAAALGAGKITKYALDRLKTSQCRQALQHSEERNKSEFV